jgi:hypothetical protein
LKGTVTAWSLVVEPTVRYQLASFYTGLGGFIAPTFVSLACDASVPFAVCTALNDLLPSSGILGGGVLEAGALLGGDESLDLGLRLFMGGGLGPTLGASLALGWAFL